MSSEPRMSSKLSFAAAFLLLRQRMAPYIGLAYEGRFLYSLSDLVTSLHFVAICESSGRASVHSS